MTNLFGGISSYNLINYLLPGSLTGIAIYVLFHERIDLAPMQSNGAALLIFATVCFYFIGLLCSRIGTLLLGTYVRKLARWVWPLDGNLASRYRIYIQALNATLETNERSHFTKRLEMLSEARDAYRTTSISFLIIGLAVVVALKIWAAVWLSLACFTVSGFLVVAASHQHAFVLAHIQAVGVTPFDPNSKAKSQGID